MQATIKQKNFDIIKFKEYVPINDISNTSYSLKVLLRGNLNDLDEGEVLLPRIIGLEVYEGDNLIGTIKKSFSQGQMSQVVKREKANETYSYLISRL